MEKMEDPVAQRWTAKRRFLVMQILKGETSLAEAGRENGLMVGEIEDWRDKFFLGAENACLHRFGTSRPKHQMPAIRSDNGLWCSKAAASGPLATITGCLRNTLLLIHLSRTA